jgi:hypothetical protein
MVVNIVDLVAMYSDNNTAIAQAKKPRSYQYLKIHLDSSLVLENHRNERYKDKVVRTKENLVDPLTKSLTQ